MTADLTAAQRAALTDLALAMLPRVRPALATVCQTAATATHPARPVVRAMTQREEPSRA